MSHVVACKTDIRNISALERACSAIPGLKFNKDQTDWKWYGKWVNDYHNQDAAYKNGIKPEDYGKCVHAISLEGSEYEIGVVRHPQYPESYLLVFDFWGSEGAKLQKAVGNNCTALIANYCKEVEEETARALGYSTTIEEDEEWITQRITQY